MSDDQKLILDDDSRYEPTDPMIEDLNSDLYSVLNDLIHPGIHEAPENDQDLVWSLLRVELVMLGFGTIPTHNGINIVYDTEYKSYLDDEKENEDEGNAYRSFISNIEATKQYLQLEGELDLDIVLDRFIILELFVKGSEDKLLPYEDMLSTALITQVEIADIVIAEKYGITVEELRAQRAELRRRLEDEIFGGSKEES